MAVIADVILAVAVIAIAPGAVTELQLRIGDVVSSAYGAAVGVGCFGCSLGGFIGAGIKPDHLGTLRSGSGLFPEQPGCVDAPGPGNHVEDILSKEKASKYINKNNEILENIVLPAYRDLKNSFLFTSPII